MSSFGKRVRERREARELTQQELAKILDTSYTVIGKYERDEMKPSIDVAADLAKALDTTVGYLVGESGETDILKDPTMLKRINDLFSLEEEDKKYALFSIDSAINYLKLKKMMK